MGIVGFFVDELCANHPQLARAVLEKPLSPLSEFIDFDNSGQPCGCLIGTAALAAGFKPVCAAAWDESGRDAVSYLADRLRVRDGYLDHIGRRVYDMSLRIATGRRWQRWQAETTTPASDARVVGMLRVRIALRLAIRESALAATSQRPALAMAGR
jgi:hypothetical protein